MTANARRACLKAALRYARRGWRVFPLKGKTPLIKNNLQAATTNRKQIRKWWSKWPDANVAIACDSQSGPIVVDLDEPKNGERHGQKLLDKLGDLPSTREAQSREGRKHLYFDPMVDGTTIARMIRLNPNGEKKYALDILGDGGYVVAPPSIHPETGKRYTWLNTDSPAPFPSSLFRLIRKTKDIRKIAPPLPDVVEEGERDTLLTSLAGSMRRRNASQEAILAALREENATRVRPPLPDSHLKRIARSIGNKVPVPLKEHMTDLGNARRFIREHSTQFRAVLAERRPWRLWDGRRWIPDITGEVWRRAKAVVRMMYNEAMQIVDEDERDALLNHALTSESYTKLNAMIQVAASEPELSTVPDDYDANPWLMNVENGTIDLRVGTLRPHKRLDLMTKLAPVVYDDTARAPRWERFLLEIMAGDTELVEYLQRAVGYALTGDTREQCLFFCYGKGANGKSTFFETLQLLFGDYGQQADFSTFMSRNSDGPRNDIATMRGARLITSSEAHSEKPFDSRTLQMLTGQDTVRARKLYEEAQDFKPTHKLWLAANHQPIVKEQTEAFWRRMRLIPFTVTFKEHQREKNLDKKLAKELPGILNWAIQGCLVWRKKGLMVPAAVRKATARYKDDMDLLGDFLRDRCTLHEDEWAAATDLYRAFSDWWLDTRGPRSQPISMPWFGRLLGERPDFSPSKRHHVRGWRGVGLATPIRVRDE